VRKSFWQGAAWLTVGAFTSKLIGAVYRVFLPRVLGDTGVGLFQMAYPIYAVLLAVSVSGVPIALSKLTAELTAGSDKARADWLADWAFVFLGALGTVMAVVMGVSAPWLATTAFHEPRAAGAIRALSPALGLVAMQAVLRGYFQGQQDMQPTAWSQILEQLTRVAVMFPLALWLLPRGIGAAAAGATLGAPAGALAGLGYLLARRARERPWRLSGPPPWGDLWRLVRIAAPMAMASLVFPLMLLTDSVVVPLRLIAAGLSGNAATAAYGRLSGEAMPLINLTLVVGVALAVSLVPSVAEAYAAGRRDVADQRVSRAIHAAWLVAMPMGGGLFVLAAPLCRYLYGETGAAPALETLAVATAILALQQVMGNALQAAGAGWAPVVNLLIGTGVKLLTAWWLVPVWGIRGAAVSTGLAALTAVTLNWRAWRRLIGGTRENPWRSAWAPTAAALIMVLAVRGYLSTVMVTPVTTALAMLLGAGVYGAAALLMGEGRFLRGLWRGR
jgi:stage V sporulation protein B